MELQIGQLVLVKLQPYWQNSMCEWKYLKLSRRYFGPFRILERIGKVAYRLELPADSHIHSVFHISVLKLFKENNNFHFTLLTKESWENHPVLRLIKILQSCYVLHNDLTQLQYLVQWEGFTESEATWVLAEELANTDLPFSLEDKASVPMDGSVDTYPNSEEQSV